MWRNFSFYLTGPGRKLFSSLIPLILAAAAVIACGALPPGLPPGPESRPTAVPPISNPPTNTAAVDAPTPTTAPLNPPTNVPESGLPAAFGKLMSNVTVSLNGDAIILKSDGIPPHGSPYFLQSDNRYEAYTAAGFRPNPSKIETQNISIQIPLNPQAATNHTQTPQGPIGLALDGVPFFNQYAANRQPLTQEIVGFDQYGGHPQQQGMYHYHVEPYYLTAVNGKDSLVGFLLDGFPIYGPEENGQRVTNNDLDAYHGHLHATAEYPNGIYHYHITAETPYISGNEFYGVPGAVISPRRP